MPRYYDVDSSGYCIPNMLKQLHPQYGRATLAGRTPGNVPRPQLIRRLRTMTGDDMPGRLARTASAVLLRSFAQHTVKARLRREVHATVCQARHDLAGRQTRELGAIGHLQNLPPLSLAQLVTRLWSIGRAAAVGACDVAVTNPALERARTQA